MDMNIRISLKPVVLKQLYRIQDYGIRLKYGGNIPYIAQQKPQYGIVLS